MESASNLLITNIMTFKSTIEEAYSEIKSVLQGEPEERMLTIRE